MFLNSIAGNGIIGGTSGGAVSNARIYNNTIINSGYLLYQNNPGGPYGLGGNIIKNNLFYNSSTFIENGGGLINHDYNAFYSIPNSPTEVHGLIGAGNPFVNLAEGDYKLNLPLFGIYLASLYNMDSFGNIRGADGVWDIGAYEYVSGSPTSPPSVPLPGDLNLDHVVNSLDFSFLNSRWLQNYSAYDLQIDGLINSLDFAIMSSNWGKTW